MDFTTPPPPGLSHWLECLVYLLGFVLLFLQVRKSLRAPLPHPPNAELELAHAQLERRMTTLENQFTASLSDAKKDRGSLYNHVSDVRKELQEDIKRHGETMHKTMEEMPERMVRLLYNTGAIGGKNK